MEQIVRIENYIVNWIKSHAKYIFINMAFGIMVYFMMISENLVNSYDGIWNTSHFIAEAWETSLGRGLLHYYQLNTLLHYLDNCFIFH